MSTEDWASMHTNDVYAGVMMNRDGHTLLEVLVVLVVVGILSAMAGPNLLHAYARVQLHAVAEQIASELRLARQLARTHRDRVVVTFDAHHKTIETKHRNGMTLHLQYHYEKTGVTVDEPSAGPDILFHPNGRYATATTIWLRNTEGEVRRMTVGLTGRVRIK